MPTTAPNSSGFPQVDVIADVVHGVAAAGKAVIVTTNNVIDTLDVTALLVNGVAVASFEGLTDVTASAAEVNLIDGSIAGTSVASKALCLGANKNTDVLVLPVSGLFIGAGAGTAVTASAAELNLLTGVLATTAEINNACDDSGKTQAVVAAAAITVDGTKSRATLTGGAYAITLAAPSAAMKGKTLVIEYIGGDTDAVTLALTNVIGGSQATTATFNADNETLILIGGEAKWCVLAEIGVVLT